MQFLAPLWLALAGAAAVPLLLHLLRRRLGTRVEFPAARYLARAEQEHSARLRFRNWLLMALRVLALLLIALAAARPVADVPGAGAHAPTALALVLDNSLSTTAVVGGRPVLDALRDDAARVLERAAPADRLWLVTADGAVTSGSPAELRAALARVEPLAGSGDLPAAVARAGALAAGAGPGARAVVVLTDGQATAWRDQTVDAGTATVVIRRAAGDPPADRAVLAAAARPARWSPSGKAWARLSGRDSVAWRVVLRDTAGQEVAAARGAAPGDGEVRAVLTPRARGWLAGTVTLEPDELRGDDERHFAVLAADPPPVLADASAGPFAESALAALRAAGRIGPPAGGAAIVSEPIPGARRPALLVAPADPARLGAANQALARLGVPWRLGPAIRAPARARLAPLLGADSAVLVDVAVRHRLEPQGGATTDTLATVGAEPWIVAGPGYVLVASAFDPAATAFPIRAAFAPWLGAVLAQRLQEGGGVQQAAPGATVVVPPGVGALRAPDGARTAVAGRTVSAPPRPGVYLWLRDGAPAGALVIDPDAEELQLARMNAGALRARVRGARVDVVEDGTAVADAAFAGRGRRPIAAGFLAAALAALVAEALVARRGQGAMRGAAATPVPRPA